MPTGKKIENPKSNSKQKTTEKVNSSTLKISEKVLSLIHYYDRLKEEASDNTEFNILQSREATEIANLWQENQ